MSGSLWYLCTVSDMSQSLVYFDLLLRNLEVGLVLKRLEGSRTVVK